MRFIFLLVIVMTISSCASENALTYLTQSNDESVDNQYLQNYPLTRIKRGDILGIQITSIDGSAANPYNLVRSDLPNNQLPVLDFLVDEEGNISYPGIGQIKLSGFSLQEAKDVIRNQVSPFVKDPIVNLRIRNFSITVTGEVNTPNRFVVGNNRVNILEAISMAGDITALGNRKEIHLIRQTDKEQQVVKLDLSKRSLLESEYFFLKQNDLLYIPPTAGRAFSARTEPYSRVILPVLGFMTTVASLIIVSSNNN